jgi:sugar/nucleoside kinase (ribokinase family)
MSRPSTRGRSLLALLFALTLVVAACGDDADTQSAPTTTAAEHGDKHNEPVDVSDLDPTPTVAVTVVEDPMSGWNLSFDSTGHELAPQDASTEHVEGEGHAHL